MADYLIHFNKNHSKANGQFVSGDGDGDGQVNDAAARKAQKTKEREKLKKTRQKIIKEQKAAWKKKSAGEKAGIIVGAVATAATIGAIGFEFVMDARAKKLDEQFEREQRAARQFAEDKRRASAAKFIGGDW